MTEITMNFTENTDEIFERFLFQKKASGLAEKTLQSYNSQFKAIAKHLDVHRPIEEITKSDLEKMIVSMRDYGLAANTKLYAHSESISDLVQRRRLNRLEYQEI